MTESDAIMCSWPYTPSNWSTAGKCKWYDVNVEKHTYSDNGKHTAKWSV